MQKQIVAAIFEDITKAERAIAELRQTGIREKAVSIVTMQQDNGRHASTTDGTVVEQTAASRGAGIGMGVATGGAVGVIAGLVAIAIPGLAPFIAAGAIGEAFGAAGSALLMSGAVGATAGGLTGALADYGMDRKDAEAFERRIRRGATLVTVETQESARDFATARAVLRAGGGETPSEQSEDAAPA